MRHRHVLAIGAALAATTFAGQARADEYKPAILPVARVMFGPAFHVGSDPLVQVLLDVDLGATVLLGDDEQFYVGGELGYTYDHGGLHAFNLMAAVGYGRDVLWYVVYQPRLLLGTSNDAFTVGLRNGVGGHFFSDLFNLEIGHQFLSTGGKLSQSIVANIGANPAAVIYLLLDP